MNKNDAPPSKIRYKYEMASEARLQTAHGVWGGINPQGEIEMNFYHESDCLPAYSERLIAPDGSIGPGLAQMDTPGSGGGRVGHGIGEAGGAAAGTAGAGHGASSPRSITGESYRSSGMTRRHTRSKISRSLPHRPGPGSGRNP